MFKIEREELASNHAPVWDIPTEDVTEERAAETVNDPNVRNPTTGRPGRRLDLSRLPIREDLQATILSDKTTFTSVTVMNLNDCGLQSLLRAISNMANLVRLRLHSNDLKTLPETIGDLRFLERLSVYGSNLESLPRSCSRLDSLKILRLGGNKLEDGGLDVIQNMSGLEQLYLRQNYELKAIPREVCLLDKLTVLDAEYCEELEYPPLRVVARGIDRVRAYAERYDW